MTEDSRIRIAQEFFQRYFGGEVTRARDLLDEQVVYHVPGSHKPAGAFVGIDAVTDHLNEFRALLQSPVDLLQWEDWMAGVNYVAGLASVHLQRQAMNLEVQLVMVVKVSEGGKIREIQAFFNDQADFERLFADEV
jgi:ketosteroid isomerase-like protein